METPGATALRSALGRSMEINGDRMPPERQAPVAGIDPQEFGRLQALVETLIKSDEVKTELLATLTADVTAMRLQLAEAKGGWRALMAIGGASASAGGLISWAISHFWKGAP